jgi:predicted nucleic-acid-binding protein
VIGLDTNILLRWLISPQMGDIGSSDVEIERASAIIVAEGMQFFVNPIVLAEMAWILEQKLRLARADVSEVVGRLLHSENITIGCSTDVRLAQVQFEQSSANFADCMIAQLNLAAGCSHTLTFDQKAGRTPGFRHVNDQ